MVGVLGSRLGSRLGSVADKAVRFGAGVDRVWVLVQKYTTMSNN